MLIRIIAAAALYAAAMAVYFTVEEMPLYGKIAMFAAVYLVIGYDVLLRAARNIAHGQVFDENFLMSLATLGAFIIGELPETVAVMLFYQVGELFQSYAVGRSRASISSLMEIRPDKAVVLRGNGEETVSPEDVEIGETIVVKVGERIPLDGVVAEGESYLDTSALTGESAPRACRAGDAVLSGSINAGSVLKIRTEKAFYDSTVNKILELVENVAGKKAKAENFITRFAKYYTPAVVGVALILFLLPSLITGEWAEWGGRALNFLVVSCPCALVISVPLSFFGGIGGASKSGVLIKGGAYMEKLAEAGVFVFDKTGTLTKGKFAVKGIYPEERADEILAAAAVCEKESTHPVARSIMEKCPVSAAEGWAVTELSGMGVVAEKAGERIVCGNEKLFRKECIKHEQVTNENTIVYVARNGEYLGRIEIGDEIKEESKAVVAALKAGGLKTVMLTGDNERAARIAAEKIGVDEYRANLLPADKVAAVEELIEREKKVVAFVGDGINDAPVLMRADVGISMGAIGSDSAIEASDVVLMKDDLRGIPLTKRIAKKTMRIVRENIVFALAVKGVILVLSALGITGLWLAVFADVGVAVLAVLNAMRTLKGAKREGLQP